MIYEQLPYTNFHNINLDWILRTLRTMESELQDFVFMNTIKYADPIQWNITTQYAKNTIVIDPATGDAYISTRPVPAGVLLSNTDYWSVIFSYQAVVDNIKSNIAYDVGDSSTTPIDLYEDDLVWWNDVLYRVLYDIVAGTALIDGVNVIFCTVNERLQLMQAAIQSVIAFQQQINDVKSGITLDEEDNIYAAYAHTTGDLVWWNDIMYVVTNDIPVGGALAIGTNLDPLTVDGKINNFGSNLIALQTTTNSIISSITADEEDNIAAVMDHLTGDLIWWNGIIYLVISDITAGDTLTNGVNVTPYTVDQRINDVDARIQQYFGARNNWFYVDGVNGDDNNDGSNSHPFKTLEKALLKANDGYANLSIGILSSGTYPVSQYNNLTYLSLHIYGYAANIIIDFTRTDFTTYGLHLNVRGNNGVMTIRGASGGFHFESGQLYAESIYFNFDMRIIGTNCHFIDCEFDNINVSESNLVFNGSLKFHNAQNVAVVCRIAGGTTSFYHSSITLDDAPSNGVTFIQCHGGVVAGFQNAAASFSTDLNNKYQYGLRSYNAVIAIYAVRLVSFSKIANTRMTQNAGTITAAKSILGSNVDISSYTSADPYSITEDGYVNIYNSTSSHNGVIYVQGNQGGTLSIGYTQGRFCMPVVEGMKCYVGGTCNFARFIPAGLAQ